MELQNDQPAGSLSLSKRNIAALTSAGRFRAGAAGILGFRCASQARGQTTMQGIK